MLMCCLTSARVTANHICTLRPRLKEDRNNVQSVQVLKYGICILYVAAYVKYNQQEQSFTNPSVSRPDLLVSI